MHTTPAITGLILAGGRGTRMGNVDKGLQILNGMPMVQHVLLRLMPQVDHMLISANRNLSAYQQFGVPVRPDRQDDFAGPLAGMQRGLEHCSTPLLVTAPCDSPFLPLNLVEKLWRALCHADADAAIAATGNGPSYQTHPVFCMLKVTLLPELTTFLQHGGRAIKNWQTSLNTVEVHFSDDTAFDNINTPEDLQRAIREQ